MPAWLYEALVRMFDIDENEVRGLSEADALARYLALCQAGQTPWARIRSRVCCSSAGGTVDAEDRIAHNETLFREVNERIEAGQWPTERGEPASFRCECGSLRCNRLVELGLEEYERVRASATHFVLVPGHEIPELERVVEREASYVVVEKIGDAAKLARETDPRDD